MRIFDRQPSDWADLQALVGQLFSELGCLVEVEKPVLLARGHKEVDVWVQDQAMVPPSTILVECKFWGSAIPQDVIHSFRTVVSDAGANRGYIVSKKGFQSGAHEAAQLTNVELVTFEELQDIFFSRWKVAIARRMMPYADRLFPYWDPFGGRMPRIKWTDAHRDQHEHLVQAYRPLVHLGPGMELNGYAWDLPIVLPPTDGDSSKPRTTLTSYRQVYDFIDANKDNALAAFQVLYGELPAQD